MDAAFADFDLTDRESYARFLAAHADAVWALEAALPGERVVDDWDDRKRGHLLKEDLAFLRPDLHPGESRAPESQATSSVTLGPGFRRGDGEVCDDWTVGAVAGTLYVLEGSRLGGKFLARHLPTGFPRAYLDADHRAGKWQQLLETIDRLLRDPVALETALAAALATFAVFERSAAQWRKVGFGER